MKTTPLIAFSFLLLVLGTACQKENENQAQLDRFIGNYEITSTQVGGVYIEYDSVGNEILEERTVTFLDPLLNIRQLGKTDTLLVDGLIKRLYAEEERQEVKAVIENDSLTILYDEGWPGFTAAHITGKIGLDLDSIHLVYIWRCGDIYSNGAIPNYGKVLGKGRKL